MTTKINDSPTALLFQECFTCGTCCECIEEGICGYNSVQEIIRGNIEEDLVKKMAILKISENYLDEFAIKWLYFPSVNLLKIITHENNGYYEFLLLPKNENGCIFLTPTGCKYPKIKMYDCRIYPFYFEKNEFFKLPQCTALKTFDWELMENELKRMTERFIEYSLENQDAYFKSIEIIKEKYNLKVYSIPDSRDELEEVLKNWDKYI